MAKDEIMGLPIKLADDPGESEETGEVNMGDFGAYIVPLSDVINAFFQWSETYWPLKRHWDEMERILAQSPCTEACPYDSYKKVAKSKFTAMILDFIGDGSGITVS